MVGGISQAAVAGRGRGQARAGRGWEAEAWEDLGTGSREQLRPVKSICRPQGLGQLGSGNDCGRS